MSLASVVDRLLTPTYRQKTPLEDQLKELLEKLDLSIAMKHSPSRSKRLKLLKKTITEVRSEISLKNSLPPQPSTPDPSPSPAESEDQPLRELLADPSIPQEDKSLPPPPLETLTLPSQILPMDLDPTPVKLTKPLDQSPTEFEDVTNTSTSVPSDTPNGHIPESLLPKSDLYVERYNRRTNVLFRKSKSASPQKLPRTQEVSSGSPPPLGAKTFLSVVIPRLETLLLPKKRKRSSSADGEDDEESPIKRLGTGASQILIILFQLQTMLVTKRFSEFKTILVLLSLSGMANGFVVEEEGVVSQSPRLLEPRRRCASESSISSSGSILCDTR